MRIGLVEHNDGVAEDGVQQAPQLRRLRRKERTGSKHERLRDDDPPIIHDGSGLVHVLQRPHVSGGLLNQVRVSRRLCVGHDTPQSVIARNVRQRSCQRLPCDAIVAMS